MASTKHENDACRGQIQIDKQKIKQQEEAQKDAKKEYNELGKLIEAKAQLEKAAHEDCKKKHESVQKVAAEHREEQTRKNKVGNDWWRTEQRLKFVEGEFTSGRAGGGGRQFQAVKRLDWEIDDPTNETPALKELRGKYHGPILYNIQVDEEYRIAVESALGNALSHVVVDDDQVGSKIVQFVRKSGVGVVECVPLNRASRLSKKFDYPKVKDCTPMVDVIKCDSWLKDVIHNIAGHYMICKDLALCGQIAKGNKFDTVTLDGDKESRTGIVTGGRIDPKRFQKLKLEADRRRFKTQIAEAKKEHEAADKRAHELNEKYEQINKSVVQARLKLDQISAEKKELVDSQQSCIRDVEKANIQKHNAERRILEHESAIKNGEGKIDNWDKEMQSKKCGGLTDAERTQVAKLEKQDIPKAQKQCEEAKERAKAEEEALTNARQKLRDKRIAFRAVSERLEQRTFTDNSSILKQAEQVVKDCLAKADDAKAEREKVHFPFRFRIVRTVLRTRTSMRKRNGRR